MYELDSSIECNVDIFVEIRKLLALDWVCFVRYAPRQTYQVADWLAKENLRFLDSLVIFEFTPTDIESLLLADVMYVPFPRFVSLNLFRMFELCKGFDALF